MRTAMLAVLLAGCGARWNGDFVPDPAKLVPPPAHAAEAIRAIAGFYGMAETPPVYWYGGAILTCDNGRGIDIGEGQCEWGVYVDGAAIVVAPPGALIGDPLGSAPPTSALAHEMGHAASDQRGEGVDYDHAGHFFAPGGEVEQATAMLQARGW